MIPALSVADFRLILPEFAAESDARIAWFIDRSAPYFDPAFWGALYADGVAYWVAHHLSLSKALAGSGGAAASAMMAGDIISKKVGDVSLTRDAGLAAQHSDNPYLRTTYGQHYGSLLRMLSVGAVAV